MQRGNGGDDTAMAGVVLYKQHTAVLCYAGISEAVAVQCGAFSDTVSSGVSSSVAISSEACCSEIVSIRNVRQYENVNIQKGAPCKFDAPSYIIVLLYY